MERKEFIKTCGFACLGGLFIGSVLEGCSGGRMITAELTHSGLVIPESAFGQPGALKKYVVVQNPQLKYPVCLYRDGNNGYTALLMRCTHQGAELQVFGDKLECPAHGSVFSHAGAVENGPADTPLRKFPVTVQNNQIFISLT